MAPFLHALMRREARLLREDADRVAEDAMEPRTSEQRRLDALVDLVTSISSVSRCNQEDPDRKQEDPECKRQSIRVDLKAGTRRNADLQPGAHRTADHEPLTQGI